MPCIPALFLDASAFQKEALSVGWTVRRLVGPSVGPLCFHQIWQKNGILKILNDLDSAGGGKKDDMGGGTRRQEGREGGRDEEEEWTGKKEGRGRRRDEESEKMKKLLKEMKKSLKDASLASLGLVFVITG